MVTIDDYIKLKEESRVLMVKAKILDRFSDFSTYDVMIFGNPKEGDIPKDKKYYLIDLLKDCKIPAFKNGDFVFKGDVSWFKEYNKINIELKETDKKIFNIEKMVRDLSLLI